MARSLFRMLHGLFDTRRTGAELLALADTKRRQLYRDRLLPAALNREALAACESLPQYRIAVVGGGLAGLTAAWYLRDCGLTVTVFEASDRIGGRVLTDRGLVAGKYVEAGAELIGTNHAMWIELAAIMGLQLAEITPETWYRDNGQRVRLRFGDTDLTDVDKEHIKNELTDVFDKIGGDAVDVDANRPWLAPNADQFDRMSVAQRLDELLPPATSRLSRYALDVMLGNDNCAPVANQSYLGLLALVSAGRMEEARVPMRGYWEYTETHRCWTGNQRLAERLAGQLTDIRYASPVQKITIDEQEGVGIAHGGATQSGERFDYVVLAAPPTSWPDVESPHEWTPAAWTMSHGPAVKHLNVFADAFWAGQGLAPLAQWDRLGSVWEGTDGQPPDQPGRGLSVYSGGVHVLTDAEYRSRLAQLYPGYAPAAVRFVDWPKMPYVWTGYSVPSPGQVCTVGRSLALPFATRLYFAGEQTCIGYFGYMEGALQSGARVARDIVAVLCPDAVGISL